MTTTPTMERTEDKVLDHVLDRTPRCWKCCRVLIDYITRPWGGLICKKCKTKNYSTPLRCPDCGHINEDRQPCPHCPPTP